MIAKFPEFSKLDLQHKSDIEAVVSRFEPYSDYNFISLFCWNTNGSTEVSDLEGNLVIKLPDYISGKPVYSFLGDNNVDESLKRVLTKVGDLQMVPEAVVTNINNRGDFVVTEDHNNHDYVYLVDEHASLPGEKFRGKRKKLKRFEKRNKGRFAVEQIDLSNKEVAAKVQSIFTDWAKAADKTNDQELKQERAAIDRLLEHAPHFNTIALVLSVDGRPAGFSIHELIGKNYAICHFHKTVANYANIDVFLTSWAAKDLANRGQKYVNWEQDLGLEGLKKSKISYFPAHMLKKYRLRLA